MHITGKDILARLPEFARWLQDKGTPPEQIQRTCSRLTRMALKADLSSKDSLYRPTCQGIFR